MATIQEIQKIESGILKIFIQYCEEHHLQYWAAYGTLLGAVRHGGFVPWDDDIDIYMPRDDYERLIKLSPKLVDDRYELIGAFNRTNWPYLYVKFIDNNTELEEKTYKSGKIGVYIDIFPLDGLPNNKILRYGHMIYLNFLHYLLITRQKTNLKGKTFLRSAVKAILYPIAKFIGMQRLLLYLNKFITKYKFNLSYYISSESINTYGLKEQYKKNWFDETISLKFEDFSINVPSGYDYILRKLYDDYMELPPLDKRKSHHEYNVKILK